MRRHCMHIVWESVYYSLFVLIDSMEGVSVCLFMHIKQVCVAEPAQMGSGRWETRYFIDLIIWSIDFFWFMTNVNIGL